MPKYVFAHYHEVALKGKNRPQFIDQLMANVRRAIGQLGLRRVLSVHNSILVELEDGARWEAVKAGLERVFGLANFSPVERTALDLEAIKQTVARTIERRSFGSFRITSRRSDKRFPLTSAQLNRELGAFVQSLTDAPVSLTQPDLTIYVNILSREALVYLEKLPGPGGLPVGSSGRVAALLSGGIDSPVAAYRLMRRGCQVIFVHFHSHPFLDASSKQKAQELAELLDRYQGDSRLYLVPFGEVQRQVVLNAPEPFRTVIYRRLMMRIASRIARVERAGALVTGDSLGQVASQTLENMAVVEQAAELSVLRPLVGMDKLEIVRQAEQIGTYAISIIPDQDCCQLFMPRHPATRATSGDIARAEERLDLEQLAQFALSDVELVEFRDGKRRRRRVPGLGGQVSGDGAATVESEDMSDGQTEQEGGIGRTVAASRHPTPDT